METVDNIELEKLLIAYRKGKNEGSELSAKLDRIANMTYATFCVEYTVDPETSQDIKQDALAHAIKQIPRWSRKRGPAFWWFMRIMDNKMRDISRATRRRIKNVNALRTAITTDPTARNTVAANTGPINSNATAGPSDPLRRLALTKTYHEFVCRSVDHFVLFLAVHSDAARHNNNFPITRLSKITGLAADRAAALREELRALILEKGLHTA